MSAFTYLPGFIANTVDGGMASPSAPTTKLTLILGTAGQGPANVAYPVTDPAQAAADYGLAGDLILGMEEVRGYCDNIVLYRLGTKQGTLTAWAWTIPRALRRPATTSPWVRFRRPLPRTIPSGTTTTSFISGSKERLFLPTMLPTGSPSIPAIAPSPAAQGLAWNWVLEHLVSPTP